MTTSADIEAFARTPFLVGQTDDEPRLAVERMGWRVRGRWNGTDDLVAQAVDGRTFLVWRDQWAIGCLAREVEP